MLYNAVELSSSQPVMEFSPRQLLHASSPDILHLHWPDVYLEAGAGWRFWPRYMIFRFIMALARMRGTKVIWTAHNLRRPGQRNGSRMDRVFWKWFLVRIDGVIFLTSSSADRARKTEVGLSGKLIAVIPHGHYRPVFPSPLPQRPSNDIAKIFFFGSITNYKNVTALLQAALRLPAGSVRLDIAGRMSDIVPDPNLVALVSGLSEEQKLYISYRNELVPDIELFDLVRGADLVVLPYDDISSSGAAIYAISAGTPVLGSNNDFFQELQKLVGSDWVTLIGGELDPQQLLAAVNAARELRKDDLEPEISCLDWAGIADSTVDFYRLVSQNESRGER